MEEGFSDTDTSGKGSTISQDLLEESETSEIPTLPTSEVVDDEQDPDTSPMDTENAEDSPPEKLKNEMNKLTFYSLYFLFILQGIASILPFNVYISAPDYFIDMFGPNIMTIISFSFLLPNCIGSFLLTLFGKKLMNKYGVFFTFILPYIWFISSLAIFPFLKMWGVMDDISRAYIFTVLFVSLSGFIQALLQGIGFSWAFRIDERFSVAISVGFGICGVLIAFVRIVSKVIMLGKKSDQVNANYVSVFVYFELASVIMFFLFMSFILMMFLISKVVRQNQKVEEKVQEKKYSIREQMMIYWNSLKMMWQNGVLIFLVFVATLSVFPGIVVAIPVSFDDEGWISWFGVLIVTLFMIGDCIGRMSPVLLKKMRRIFPINEFHFETNEDSGEPVLVKNAKICGCCSWLFFKWFLVLIRFVSMMLMNVAYVIGYYSPGFDFIGLLNMVFLSISNGFLTSTILEDAALGNLFRSLKLTTKKERMEKEMLGEGEEGKENEEESEVVGEVSDFLARGGQLINFFMVFGIFIGSSLELGWYYGFKLLQQPSWKGYRVG